MIGALVPLGYAVALGLLVAAAFWLFRPLLQPTRDLRTGRRRPGAMVLILCVVLLSGILAAALIRAHADGVSIVDLLLLRRLGSADPSAWNQLWPERTVFTLYGVCVIALVIWAVFRER